MEEAMSTPASTNTRLSVYDGRKPVATVEEHEDGWYVRVRNRHVGICADRKAALDLVTITLNPTAA
jgi:hypothetical protein